MTQSITRLVCHGCGAQPPADDPYPFKCSRAGKDDVDHVLRRELRAAGLDTDWRALFLDEEPNPFVRYRQLLHSYDVAIERALSDADWVDAVSSIDRAIENSDGSGFRETRFAPSEKLNSALERTEGSLWIKDETGNVSGSHKARHLMGVLLWLEMARRTGLVSDGLLPRLAIASCGNAALGAAVVARAAGRALDVFIPTDAHPSVVEQLGDLGATLAVCPRDETRQGDPCVHRFQDAVASGALPFSVQGNENGLAIEGGLTLGYEIVSSLLRTGTTIDRLFVQVGGGALASSCIESLRDAKALGLIDRLPIIHAVQTEGAYPLWRAWNRVVRMIETGEPPDAQSDAQPDTRVDVERAVATSSVVRDRRQEALRYAATHRSVFMSPWETIPSSIAHGILDDETYDWLAVVEGLVESGGCPIVASEEELRAANELARSATSVPVDHTGSSGLAGALALLREGGIGHRESLAVLFTGRERSGSVTNRHQY